MDSVTCDYTEACTLCAELNGQLSAAEPLASSFWQERADGRIVRRFGEWVVMPTIGPLAVGHVLFVSKPHFPSVAHLTEIALDELGQEMRAVRQITEAHLPPLVFFEHGSMGLSNRSGACTDHAHVHGVPISATRLMEVSSTQWTKIGDLCDLRHQAEKLQPYLYLQDEKVQHWISPINNSLPCQFLRRAAAQVLGCTEEWDWQIYPRLTEMSSTMEIFLNYNQ